MNRSKYRRALAGRRCARCKRDLPLTAFGPNPKLQDGVGSWCKECHIAATRKWRADHAAEINERKREEHARNRDAINARRRAAYREGKAA